MIHTGDCVEVMRGMEADSVDAVVTDPPYNLSFMGKSWDKNLNHGPWAIEAFRVLKPGGYLLAFGGTRTVHRLASAIEDAGFEIRDELVWIYASGFPKSLDVGKAMDKVAPRAGQFEAFAAHFREQRIASGLKQKDVAKHFPSKTGGLTGCVANWELGYNVPTMVQWHVLQPMLGLSDEWWDLIERAEAEREKVGTIRKNQPGGTSAFAEGGIGAYQPGDASERDVFGGPATDLAKQWDGWGTALKPAHEPIVMARKPLQGTVVGNVAKWGTGALNIDGTRIGTTDDLNGGAYSEGERPEGGVTAVPTARKPGEFVQPAGRWPSNVLLSDPELFDSVNPYVVGSGDSGGYSRFFIVPKADRADREPIVRPDGHENGKRFSTHPTMKPTDLMRHLVRLVTPPGGTVLDPFLGSGTTAIACELEGFPWIGIEKEPEYVAIAEARLNGTQRGLGLDVPAPTKAPPKTHPDLSKHQPKRRAPAENWTGGWVGTEDWTADLIEPLDRAISTYPDDEDVA